MRAGASPQQFVSATVPNNPPPAQTTTGYMPVDEMPTEFQDFEPECVLEPVNNVGMITDSNTSNGDGYGQLIPQSWPAGLPSPDVTRHLYEHLFPRCRKLTVGP